MPTEIEDSTLKIGRELFARAQVASRNGSGESWLDRVVMQASMRDERVKAQLFRFVDVLPGVLESNEQITRHLREYLLPVRDRLPEIARDAIARLPTDGWAGAIVASAAKFGARRMARRFIAADTIGGALDAIRVMRRQSLGFTIDLLGEAVLSESEATHYQNEYLRLIDALADGVRDLPPNDLIDNDDRRPIPRVNVSIKLSSLYSQFDPIDPVGTSRAVRERLRPILRLARSRGAFVNVDMEQYAYKDVTLRIFREVFEEQEFLDWPDVGIAIQAYLRDCGDDLRALATWVNKRGTPVWVRLVKGAYWDYESVVAAQNGWPLPVFANKLETDANYEAQTTFLLEHRDLLRPAIGSHNIRSVAHALATAQTLDLPRGAVEFQMLYGMADPIKAALVARGERVRVYTPFGQLLPGMAYLVRRLLENTSNESFLRAGFIERLPEEQLLMNPLTMLRSRNHRFSSDSRNSLAVSQSRAQRPFVNEPITDFSRVENLDAMQSALNDVKQHLGQDHALVIDGRPIKTGTWIESKNPSHRFELVGRCSRASVSHANDAVAAAKRAFAAWRDTPAETRADFLFRSAEIFRRRRFELAAWEVYETAKPWREADADVAEAIDYCEFYAREMIRLAAPAHRDFPGEENETLFEPRGVAVSIAPWNFPLAILCGMTTAALVAGNPTIMKPAEQSSVIAAKLMEVFAEAGFPPGVVQYLPGVGEEIGPTLVSHPDVAIIVFTGSRAVGLAIQRQAAEVSNGQDHLKRVITELGGKNAIIIDDDADLDEAVHGVVASAFGYAGQKCSACSRVIAIESIHDAFLVRLIEATRSLKICGAEEPARLLGPVIDEEARERLLKTIDAGKREARLAYAGDVGALAQEGSYVAPHLFADVAPDATIAQEELFGPVLCILKARDLTHAMEIAMSTKYALTGGLFSRSPANIERVRRDFRVGNLYINRKITGALVDRQPFGGFKLSGTGIKAGSSEYLSQFLLQRTITENTLRHGFAPTGFCDASPAGE